MTQLCIDARWLESGIGTHTLNLLRELGNRPDLEVHAVTYPRHKAILETYCRDVRVVNARIYSVSEQLAVTEATKACPLLHVPHYNVPLPRRGTLLVTIHDLTHILDDGYRNTWKSWAYARPMLRLAARKADHIFTVSEYSKRQIIEHLGVADSKVTVTYCGVGPEYFPEPMDAARERVQKSCGLERPYILNVGSYRPHKNVEGLMRAFARVRQTSGHDWELLLIGEFARARDPLMKVASRLGVAGRTRIVGRVPDDILRAAYSAAELTVVPSFEEGFGLPMVESMACGTPVVCSRAASLPEVAGDAAEYFDPRDVESIANALERVLLSRDTRARLRQRGFERTRQFSWQACANAHVEIYRQYSSPAN